MDTPAFKVAYLHPRYWLLWLGIALLWLLTLLPYRLLMVLGRMLGGLLYHVAGSRRRIAARNLELCMPDLDAAARERLLRENFASMGMTFFEMTIAWWWPVERLRRLAREADLDPVFAEKFLSFVVAEVIRHHEAIAQDHAQRA